MKNEPVEEEYNELPPPLTPQGPEDGDVEVLPHSPSSQLNGESCLIPFCNRRKSAGYVLCR